MRNFIATLMLSQGVPMLSHGDEFARTQGGNNNAYCQDNELSWVRWPAGGEPESPTTGGGRGSEGRRSRELLAFTRAMVWLRRDHPVFRRRRFFHGPPGGGHPRRAVRHRLVHPGGRGDDASGTGRPAHAKALAVFLNGNAISEPGAAGRADHRRLVPADVQRPAEDAGLRGAGAPRPAVAGRGGHRPPGGRWRRAAAPKVAAG